MRTPFEMLIQDVFRLRDGRVVLVGPVEGHPKYMSSGQYEIWVEGSKRASLRFEGEMISSNPTDPSKRAISTTATRCLDREDVAKGRWVLKPATGETGPLPLDLPGMRSVFMHRHLLGVDSPPAEYVADPMTQGPILPEGWDGDAWVDPAGHGCFLRAWNKSTGRVAIGDGPTYEEARRALLNDVARGRRRVVVTAQEVG